MNHAGGNEEAVTRLEERMGEDGAFGYWEWRLEELQGREAEGESVSPVYMAAAFAGTGARDEALDRLQDAVRSRDRRLTSVRTDAVWDLLRSDPRFVSLIIACVDPESDRCAARASKAPRMRGLPGPSTGRFSGLLEGLFFVSFQRLSPH